MNHHKYQGLDSLRGLAAISVCLGHFYLMNHTGSDLRPWCFYEAGHEAVLLFFILSGFVLSSFLAKLSKFSYVGYVIRRLLRIYPTYYFAVLTSIVVFFILKPHQIIGLSGWFNSWASTKISADLVIHSVVLVMSGRNGFDSVVWSLTHEIIISVLFPMVYYAFKCFSKRTVWFLLLCYLMCLFILLKYVKSFNPYDIYASVYYLIFFMFGAFIFFYKEKLCIFSGNYGLTIGVIMYIFRFASFGIIDNMYLSDLIVMFGSGLIIINAIYNTKLKILLSNRIIYGYGKMSYSFYLLHLPILYLCVYLWYGMLSLLIIKCIIFIVASICAYFTHKYIELKFIKIARQFTLILK